MGRIRRTDGTTRSSMTVTIDADLYRWLSKGMNRSDTVESLLRAAWRQDQAYQRGGKAKLKNITDPTYAYDPSTQAHINALSYAKTLVGEMTRYNLKSQRSRMLKYELRNFIEEGISNGE
tara:strand:+ start:2039 stop:2398 length:360 start_codon:yes stop_codon:yes gene_type:complete